MAKTKRSVKAAAGFPLEVQFTENGYTLLWDNRIRMSATEYNFFRSYLSNHSTALLFFGAVNNQKLLKSSPSLRFLHSFSVDFLRSAAQAKDMAELEVRIEAKLNDILPELKDSSKVPPESLQKIYSDLFETLRMSDAPLSKYIESVYQKAVASMSISFSIEELPDDEYPFRLLVTCKHNGNSLSLHEVAALLGEPEKTLPSISVCIKDLAPKSALVKKIYNEGKPLDSIKLSREDMHTFLKELELYDMYGVTCKVPNRWKKHHSSLTLGLTPSSRTAQLGADAILNFDINLSIDGEKLSDEEIKDLLKSGDNLFMFHGKWVELKRSEMRSCLAAYESLMENSSGIALADAMRAFLTPDNNDEDEEYFIPDFEFDNSKWLESIRDYDDSALFDVSKPSEHFTATLRPYQLDGVRWLTLMRRMGLGACLSDDMGLGKTVQAIAVLERIHQETGGQSLIVIPASLLQNWQDELSKFAPHIKYRVLHSNFTNMRIDNDDSETDVFITTYSMLSRLPQLRTILWECIILDEAQAIKNPRTMQSKAAKQLNAKFRIAMTGTPIENSITDLWSIFDFLNPQLFHTSLDILASLSEGENTNEKLRRFVRPFILRRLKTDKSIISDLPEKIEMKTYCPLTQRQAVLYKQIVNSLSDEINYIHGMERRGLVLSGILRLKQICNHPDQYTGHGAFLPSESGKMMRLVELCTEIKERRERVLVFTQFKEMCQPLSDVLSDLFGVKGLIIHGSTSIAERGAIVDRFNNPDEYVPYIVLSLRAGGVGLNLTAANHVIHFDRWWNPAVENQATDRAFRIGQTNNVIVHKLICTGTLEEKIDKLIEHKHGIAMDIVENDVKLTELSNEELLALLNMDD